MGELPLGICLKIIIPIHYFPPKYLGGAELYALSLAKALIKANHCVIVVSIEEMVDTRNKASSIQVLSDEYEGVPVKRLYVYDKDCWQFKSSFNNALIGEWFHSFLLEEKPDIVHFQSAYRLSAAITAVPKKLNIPSILTLHDYWFICPRLTLLRSDGSLCENTNADICTKCCTIPDHDTQILFEDWMENKAEDLYPMMQERQSFVVKQLSFVDRLITPTHFVKNSHKKTNINTPMNVIYFGIDPLIPSLKKIINKKLRVTFMSHLHPHKGIKILLEALLRLKDISEDLLVHLYGSAESYPNNGEELYQLIKEVNYIKFLGSFSPQDLPIILSNTDVVVVPSRWYENSPLVILQALANGIPVVATNIGGIPEFIHHGINGLLFERDNVDDLEKQLRSLVESRELVNKLSCNAKYNRIQAEEIKDLEKEYALAMH